MHEKTTTAAETPVQDTFFFHLLLLIIIFYIVDFDEQRTPGPRIHLNAAKEKESLHRINAVRVAT